MKFTQWLMIKEAKKPMPTNPQANDDNLIQGKVVQNRNWPSSSHEWCWHT